MKIRSAIFILALCLMFGSITVFSKYNNSVYEKEYKLNIDNREYSIISVSTSETRTMGLSGMKELSEDKTMLFTFDEPDKYGIWMKEMNFSIDILWLDEKSKIVHIENNISPKTYPKVFFPPEKSLYVLEANAGFVLENNLSVGKTLNITQK